jgi:metal-responsive CopG/Arc/MetJ family transcriptional regulator
MIALKPRPKHERLSITVPEPLYHRIHSLAAKHNMPISQVISTLVLRALDKEEKTVTPKFSRRTTDKGISATVSGTN